MSFAGASVVADGWLLQSAMVYSGTASSGSWWYHHLVVEGYSRIKHLPSAVFIKSRSFSVGGYHWALKFYPNGCRSERAGFVSVYLVLDQDVAQSVKVHWQFSFVDEVDKQVPARIRASKARDFSANRRCYGQSRFITREDLEKSEHVKDDCFTIRCDFIIAEAGTTFIKVPPSNICEHLNHLFVTKVGADVMFKVGCESFAAHRNILAARSAVFMAELFGPMKEGTTADAIQVQDMEPDVFKALLGFIYTDSMPKMEIEVEAGDEVMWLQHLLVAADRYDLQRLKLMCEESLSGHIDVSSVMSIAGLADQHHCCGLKEACLQFLQVNYTAGVTATSEWQHLDATDVSALNEHIAKLALEA